MDTSEIYIKMCDCPEIQGEWEPEEGDYFWDGMGIRMAVDYENWSGDVSYVLTFPKAIWLPRQDQIQKMIWPKYYFSLISELDFIIQKIKKDKVKARYYWERFVSWEQLWFAFYMQEKHQKIWDGESWGVVDVM